jgi:hypothetical protein
MRMTPRTIFTAAAMAVCMSMTGTVAFADSKIGVAAAVKNDVQGRGSRAIDVGSEVFANERIRTGEAATAQFLFLDKTVMSLGPKAELVLDKYAYNPSRSSGQVVVNAVQGSMRFVTGAQNPTNYAIKTPVATLGIRGTVVDLKVQPYQTFVGLIEGLATLKLLSGVSITIGKGEYIIVSSSGAVIGKGPYNGSDPNRIETADWNRIDEINQLNAIDARNYVAPKPQRTCNYPTISNCIPTDY